MSGCTCLSYGVESGSQKVLLDMRKKVDIWEIENNLKHGAEVGLFNHINWMIGFPTEEPIDFLHSLQAEVSIPSLHCLCSEKSLYNFSLLHFSNQILLQDIKLIVFHVLY